MSVGKVYVIRGLRHDERKPNSDNLGPRLALIAKVLAQGVYLVRLRIGGFGTTRIRYHPSPRRVTRANLVREATRREVIMGMPL